MSRGPAYVVRRVTRWCIGLVLGLAVGAAVLLIGPRQAPSSCSDIGFPNTLFGDSFFESGGIDGPGCTPPELAMWVIALAVLVGITVLIGKSRPYVPDTREPHVEWSG